MHRVAAGQRQTCNGGLDGSLRGLHEPNRIVLAGHEETRAVRRDTQPNDHAANARNERRTRRGRRPRDHRAFLTARKQQTRHRKHQISNRVRVPMQGNAHRLRVSAPSPLLQAIKARPERELRRDG